MAKRKRPKGKLSNPMGMMEQIQQMQQQIVQAQNQLAEEKITATSGGGVVSVTITGDQRCTDIQIAPELLQEGDAEMLQDMLVAAINSALEQSRQMAEERLTPLTSGLSGLGL